VTTRDQAGHGGRMNKASAFGFAVVAGAGLLALLVAGGCSSEKKVEPGANAAGPGAGGVGEEGLGGKGSLEQFQKGTLGSGSGGPLSDIHFDYDAFTIQAQDGEILKTNAAWLKAHPGTRVQVEGHCDDRGSEEYNIALGARRAQAAKEYLTTLGVGGDRISTISYGKELPLCHEENDDCWARNRRDHFVVSQ
jgi:peptidoglycan-associated lipoprotein